ncbi:MAG: hypothetical protein GY696_35095 [Gammaproteobacteria bacterium]|nr:hypothetical protein [Gammaproteobacteria bacterium]
MNNIAMFTENMDTVDAPTGSGAEPPATFLRRSRPGVWGGAPDDSIKPTGLVSPRGAKFV